MNRQPVTSSQLVSVGYDLPTKVLEIQFKPTRNKPDQPGSIYQYRNVPPQLHEKLMKADSVGKFFTENVKPYTTLYPFTKIS